MVFRWMNDSASRHHQSTTFASARPSNSFTSKPLYLQKYDAHANINVPNKVVLSEFRICVRATNEIRRQNRKFMRAGTVQRQSCGCCATTSNPIAPIRSALVCGNGNFVEEYLHPLASKAAAASSSKSLRMAMSSRCRCSKSTTIDS
jgi:hypothetical protein